VARILVVDDEPQIRRALRAALLAQAHEVAVAESGEAALDALALAPCDLVILDLGLPDMDGAEVCARLREWTQVPVIVLSVRDDEKSKVLALDRGADDYLVKPFSVAELLARVRAHLRRAREEVAPPLVQSGALAIDLVRRRVEVDGQEVRLTRKEFDLLAYLATNRGRVLTHRMLLQHVWGPEYGSEVQYLRVFVSQLRRKLEPDPHVPRYVLTDVGVGYRFPDIE
jgi:two-component system, OmpR family, KDP operon response regulator KdpE